MPDNDRTRDLRRLSMPGGGEVFQGPLADEALDAVSARAMTLDGTILVAEDFDPNDPEDQALYAHERHHQLQGADSEHGGGHDAEELAARAIESMVLHRATQGEDLHAILRDVDQGRIGEPDHVGGTPDAMGTDGKDPMAAYRRLRAQGWTHDAIVRLLADHVLSEVRRHESDRAERGPLTSSLT